MKLTDIIKEIIKIKMYPGNQGVDVDMDKSDSAEYKSYPKKEISIEDLVLNEPASKMKSDESVKNLKGLVKLLKSGKKLDPILVRQVGDKYQILDGHHRYFANKIVGNKSISSIVIPEEDIEFLKEIRIKRKQMLGKGLEHNVYPTSDPDKVVKVGETKYVKEWLKDFESRPDIFPIIYRKGISRDDKDQMWVVMEKVDTEQFEVDYDVLEDLLDELVGYYAVLPALRGGIFNKEANKKIYTALANHDQDIADFYVKLRDVVAETLPFKSGLFKTYDFHRGQFGYDKKNNIKMFDY